MGLKQKTNVNNKKPPTKPTTPRSCFFLLVRHGCWFNSEVAGRAAVALLKIWQSRQRTKQEQPWETWAQAVGQVRRVNHVLWLLPELQGLWVDKLFLYVKWLRSGHCRPAALWAEAGLFLIPWAFTMSLGTAGGKSAGFSHWIHAGTDLSLFYLGLW